MAGREGYPGGWRALAALILAVPLVQGGTPRLPTAAVSLGLLGIFAAWIWRWRREPRQSLQLTAVDGVLALLLFWALFSTLGAPYYHAAEGVLVPLGSFLLGYWGLAARPSFRGWRAAAAAVRIQAAGQALLALGQGLVAGQLRPAGTFVNPNFLAGFLAVAILLVLGDAFRGAEGGGREAGERPAHPVALRRAAGIAEAAILLAGLLVTGSRGGVLALVAGLAVLLGLRSLRVLALVTALAVAGLALVPNPIVGRLQRLEEDDPFAWTRFSIWKSAAAMALDHPFTGIGVGQYEYVSPRYAFPVPSHWAKHTHVAENAHNDYLQAAAELGFPGLLLMLAAAGIVAAATVAAVRRAPPERRATLAPLAAGLAAIATQAAVDFPLRTPPAALLVVLLALGLRINGVTGPSTVAEVRVRAAHRFAAALVVALAAAAAVRPVAGFWFFLSGIGAPPDLLHERWAVEEAPREALPAAESIRLLRLAATVDWPCASYHRALGGRLFQEALRGGGDVDPAGVERALYQINLATALNPQNHQYFVNLGEAATSLARRSRDPRPFLEEALGHYRQAASLAPFSFPVYERIGAISDELGDAAAAEGAFRRAVEIERFHLRGWINLGVFLARQGRYDEALATFRTGAELAAQAATLVPTSPTERAMIAIPPADFYTEIDKIGRLRGAPGHTE